MRKMKAVLSADSLTKLADEFKAYVNSLDMKCEQFTERLINEVGIPIVEQNISSFRGDSDKHSTTYVEMHRYPNKGVFAKLVVQNEDILFIEFGAGIRYNNGKAHPQASELGYGVGTYPGQQNAINPGYWWYKDDGGDLHLSFGTEATMPLYKAYIGIVDQVGTIAREVFGNG